MKLKNAGIEKGDWKEAVKRLQGGEILYSQYGDKFGYREENILSGLSPFIITSVGNNNADDFSLRSAGDAICGIWRNVDKFQAEVHWTQNLPQFCWVWDHVEEKYTTATLVTEYVVDDEYQYKIGSVGVGVVHAEPFDLSKLKIGGLK